MVSFPVPNNTYSGLIHSQLIKIALILDCFVDRVTQSNIALGKPAPILIGLALNEQIIDSVPTEAHDRYTLYKVQLFIITNHLELFILVY